MGFAADKAGGAISEGKAALESAKSSALGSPTDIVGPARHDEIPARPVSDLNLTRMTKLTVNRLAHALDDLASHMDLDQFALAGMTEDHKEGVAAFLERRKPRFRGK